MSGTSPRPSILDVIAANRARKQGEMVAAWQKHIDGGGTRATIVAACGLGKTVVSGRIALDYRSVVFLVPSIHLLIQAAREWRERFGRAATVLVCSHKERKGALPGELDGITITTQADDIKAKIGAAPFLIFATYDSYAAVGGALLDLGRSADLLVCDEAHHLAGAEGKVRARALHNEHLPATLRLFLTATPRINTRGEAKLLGMDNEDLFGPTVITAGFGEARELSLVCDHKILVVRVPSQVDTDHPAALAAAMHNATKKALDDGLFRFAIGFRRTIDLCEDSAAEFRRLGVEVAVVSGKQTVPERMKLIAEIQASGGVVLTSQAVGEGVDIPAVDAVLFFDEKESIVSITQNAGRALRIDPTRLDKVAYIVAPVIVHDDTEVTFTGALGTVLAALSALDERLYAALRATSRAPADPATARAWTGKEVEVWTLDEMSAAGLGAAMFREAAGADDAEWEYGFSRLLAFVAREGRAQVPARFVDETGYRLGEWVHKQRQRANPARICRLRSIPGWCDNVWGAAWTGWCARWRAFWEREGRGPRVGRGSPEEASLGRWASSVRGDERKGRLSSERRQDVSSLPGWEWAPEKSVKTAHGREALRLNHKRPERKAKAAATARRASNIRWLTLLPSTLPGLYASGCTHSVATRLIADGLATRTGSPDARNYTIEITPAGTAYLAEHGQGAAGDEGAK